MSMLNTKQAMEQTARKYGVSYEEVYREIEAAIAKAMKSTDTKRRKMWDGIPCQGSVPTPIELIEFLRDYCLE